MDRWLGGLGDPKNERAKEREGERLKREGRRARREGGGGGCCSVSSTLSVASCARVASS